MWLVEKIEINGGFLPGVNVNIPPGLTCIIGPRGSGKSTLAEALRFAVCGTSAAGADITAKQAIETLASRYKNLHFVRLGNTHAKILIKDHEFAAITSFNWLSFGGDPNQAYRDEQGVLLQKQDLVDAKYDEVVRQFTKS
jgi:energy-coupling factor transporter ATP-binding protein EcfA2